MDDILTQPDSLLWAVFHAGIGFASVSILATLVLVVRWLETATDDGRLHKVTAAVLEKLVVLFQSCYWQRRR